MKEEITGLIVTGGPIDLVFAQRFIMERPFDRIIAVDRGLNAVSKLKLIPDAIVGDFDSADESVLKEFKSKTLDTTWEIHKPEKDETDTELAIITAIRLGCTKLILLGATGGRLDHFLGNLHLLYASLKQGVEAAIVDERNWITVTEKERVFEADQIFGKYISFLPLSEEVKGISLTGFKYPLHKKDITIGTSLCISNELTGAAGKMEFDSGILICVESHD
ncbi:thiamine diphosphokinase [Lacrimispora algidixylanolytica]|uniref:thiamine diphosphokinase n=1 Tax=Lacrimispora algidixylanolytica TaxID=94868 RepID=UPI000E76BCA2|nr:thiamine diphosphokinase [Lacrimispora algidixylanolytica]